MSSGSIDIEDLFIALGTGGKYVNDDGTYAHISGRTSFRLGTKAEGWFDKAVEMWEEQLTL